MFENGEKVLLMNVMDVLKESTLSWCKEDPEHMKKFLTETTVVQANANHTYMVGPIQKENSLSYEVACDKDVKTKKFVNSIIVKTVDEAIEYMEKLTETVE